MDLTPSIKTKPIFSWKKKMRGEKRIGKGEGEEKIEEKEGRFQFYYLVRHIIYLLFFLYDFSSTLLSFSLFSFFQTKQAISKMK